jgi:hypothetical protein
VPVSKKKGTWARPPASDTDREVVELRERLAQQAHALEQMRDEVGWLTKELIARDAGGDTDGGGGHVTDGAPPEWRPMLHAIRRLVYHHVPQGCRLVVVSSGVESVLRYAGYRAEHLSQDELGGYVGSHPSCSRVAIVQLEAARWRGADVLLIPRSELWWLEQYPNFAQHLDQWYTRVADDEVAGVIWDLREPGRLREVHDLLASLCGRLDHPPTLLDWHTGHGLASCFSEYKVFSPLGNAPALPYLDGTVDVVAVGDVTAEQISEARRVASSFVIRIPSEPIPGIDVLWRASHDDGSRSISIVVASLDGRTWAPGFVDRLLDTLPTAFAGEVVIERGCEPGSGPTRAKRIKVVDCPENESHGARLRRCAAAAAGNVLVTLDGATWPTPGWLRPLVAHLRDVKDAGFVTGMLVAADGRLLAAGSYQYPERARTEHEEPLDAARHGFVRCVDPSPARFFATHRDLFLEWSETAVVDDGVAAAFGAFVRSHGRTLLYEPEAVVISSRGDGLASSDVEGRVG